MKANKRYIRILPALLLLPIHLFAQQKVITLSDPHPANGASVYEAKQTINLDRSFSYTANGTHTFTARINKALVIPGNTTSEPSDAENYIITRTMTKEDGSTYREVIQYFDGLGREKEDVALNASPPNGFDLVTDFGYDDYGRQTKTWLPSPGSNNDGRYYGLSLSTAAGDYSDNYPYSETVYEKSPLNRPEQQFGPGEVWRNNSRSVKTAYLTNTASGDQSCRQYEMAGDNVKLQGIYAASQLYVTKTTDEDNNESYEFKDKLGRVLLQRRIDTRKTDEKDKQCDTYYIYDDFGNLRYMLSPMASDGMNTTNMTYKPTDQIVDYYAYIYKYDYRNRCIEKKLPGVDWRYYVYDKADRLRLTQDGVQRSKNEWTYYKYDALGRQIITGTFTQSATRDKMQSNVESNATLFESLSASTDGTYKLYTNTGYPKTSEVTNMKELINLYYDNYDFVDAAGTLASDFKFTSNVSDNEYTSAKGLQTGSRSALLDESGKYIYRHTRYDAFGRPIQIKSTNTIDNEMDWEFNKYNFTGQVVEKNIKTKTNIVSEKYKYNYDNMGRMLSTWYYLNNDAAKLMDSCTYDKFGRLLTKNVGGIDNTKYSYNVRSWQIMQDGTNLKEELFYTSSPRWDIPGQFGGNIIAKKWTTSESSATRGMIYIYDPLDRLTNSVSGDGNGIGDNGGAYGEVLDYDKNGNPTYLVRSGRLDNSTFGYFDYVITSYLGNKLLKATEYRANQNASDVMEIKAGTGQYAYDANGRLTADPHKGITNIEYNIVNLPRRITFNNYEVEYVYDAMGTKFQTTYLIFWELNIITDEPKKDGKLWLSQRDYAANKIYENRTLTRLLTPEGYVDVSRNNYSHYYYVKDYQSNNRMVLNSSGGVVQATNYYPYGASYAEPTARSDQYVQPYKFGGKELDRMMGMDYYDNSARIYDPLAGRFWTMDPLAEKYPDLSPYCAFGNNPLRYIDLRGDSLTIAGQQSEDALNQLQARAGNSMKLSRDENTGNVSYTVNTDKNGNPMKLKGDAKRLAEVIGSTDKTVNVVTRESDKTSNNYEFVGGAFMGNTVTKDANGNVIKVDARQEVNPGIFGRADAITGKPGQLMMHEVTEAFEGARISQRAGVGVGFATEADITNSESVYSRAHNSATFQPEINRTPIGTTLHGTIRYEYSIRGKIFFTTPIF